MVNIENELNFDKFELKNWLSDAKKNNNDTKNEKYLFLK